MTEAETTIRALEDQRYAAMIAGDVATLDRLLSDRLVYTHSNCVQDSKDTYLGQMKSGALTYLKETHGVDRVIMTAEAAIVHGRMTATVMFNGPEKDIGSLVLLAYVKEDGDWKLVSYQPTPLPKA